METVVVLVVVAVVAFVVYKKWDVIKGWFSGE